MDFFAAVATYSAPKAIAAVASKAGASKLALAVSAAAPSIMSYTFYTALTEHTPRMSMLFLVPQVGFSVLSLASLGPTPYVFKNMLLPSVASLVAYFGWVPDSALPKFWLDYVKGCSMAAVAVLVVMHLVYCGRAVAVRLVYPAPIIGGIMDLPAMRDKALNRAGVSRHAIPSSRTRGVSLDSLIHTSKAGTDSSSSTHHHHHHPHHHHLSASDKAFPNAFIIYVGGNGEVAEVSIDSVRSYAQHLGAHGVVFNPRGVGASGGVPVSSSAELVEDLLDVIQYLMQERGAREEDIILFGHSIGGGLSGEVVAKHHPRVSVVFDRTFSSLYDAARSMMPALPEPLVRHVLPVFFGEFPNGENWKKIEHDRKVVSFHRDDQIIRFGTASLARLDNFHPSSGVDSRYLVELSGRSTDPHNSPTEFFTAGHVEILRRMATFLEQAQEEKTKTKSA